MGDFLAILAALSWAFYSVMIKKIGTSYKNIYISRKIFFYAILTMLPVLIYEKGNFGSSEFFTGKVISNLLFLGILASSICYVLWNKVIFNIGAVKANNFIYLSPLFTTIFSALILHEKITLVAVLGGILIIFGVYVSEKKINKG